jgi:hypothetical protein
MIFELRFLIFDFRFQEQSLNIKKLVNKLNHLR